LAGGAWSVPANSSATITINGTNPAVTIEQIGQSCLAPGNPGVWVTINHSMSDAGVTAWAQRLYNATTRGTKIYPHSSNKIFIPNFIYGAAQEISALIGNGFVNTEATVMQRTYEIQNIFASVWGSDSGSIVRLFQPWTVNPGNTLAGMTYAQQNGIPIDCIA